MVDHGGIAYHRLTNDDTCIRLNEKAVELRPVGNPERTASLKNLADALFDQYMGSNDLDTLDRGIALREEILESLSSDDSDACEAILSLADGLFIRFKRLSSVSDIQRATELRKTALALFTPQHKVYPQILRAVAETITLLAEKTKSVTDIEDALEYFRELSQIEVTEDPTHLDPGYMYACVVRFELTGRVDGLQNIIDAAKRSIEAQPSSPDRHRSLWVLAITFLSRWQHTLDRDDLEASITYCREAAELQPETVVYGHDLADMLFQAFLQCGNMLRLVEVLGLHRKAVYSLSEQDTHYAAYTRDFAKALLALVEHTEMEKPLQESMDLLQKVIDILPEDQPIRVDAQAKIAHAKVIRHRISGSAPDLDEAIVGLQLLLDLPACSVPNRPTVLHNIGGALTIRYNSSHNIGDLQKAISMYEELLAVPDVSRIGEGRLIVTALRGLADSLWDRFVAEGNVVDFNHSVSSYEKALLLCREDDAERLPCLISYGVALHRKFELHGNMDDEEDSIRHLREAVKICPAEHRHRSTAVKFLGSALAMRYFQMEEPSDIDDAVKLLEESLTFYPEGRSGRADALHDLATALLARYNIGGTDEDFSRAVEYHQEASRALQIETRIDSGPRRARNLIGLSDAYYSHFIRSRNEDELNACIDLRRQALDNLPPGHYSRPKELHKLAVFVAARGSNEGFLDEIEEALILTRQSLDERGPDHADRCLFFESLATLHLRHFMRSADENHLEAAISSFIESFEDSGRSARLRLSSAVDWLQAIERITSMTSSQRREVLRAYQKTIQLLPQVAYFGLDVASRLQALKESERLANDAAAHALVLGQPDIALELLEAGRAVFWTQVLRLRTPFDDLPPELARELKTISQQLDGESNRRMVLSESAPDEKRMVEEDIARRRRLSVRFDALVAQVRQTEGLEHFLLNQEFAQLARAAEKGPVVVLLASRHSCYAVVIKDTARVEGIPLPSVTHSILEKISVAARGNGGTFRNVGVEDVENLVPVERAGRRNVASDANPLLGYLWQQVVKPVIKCLGLKPSKGRERPRLWWCPTGPFSFLPIHAAGIYGVGRAECCSDYIVSSYTPTLGALIDARARLNLTSSPSSASQVLLIAEPGVPGTPSHLQSAEEEAQVVASVLEYHQVPYKTLVSASLQTVVSQLQTAHFVHLSCHGEQDLVNPLKSGFLLRDYKLTISELIQLQLRHAFFAFLGACETAKGDLSQPDQTVHLAATMLFAGFSSVVGTMWSMWDQDGPRVARAVYESLFESEELDPDAIPYALDDAVQHLRSLGLPPERWATYIHIAV